MQGVTPQTTYGYSLYEFTIWGDVLANISALEAIVTEADAIDDSLYTVASYTALMDEVGVHRALLTDDNATQYDVDNAVAAIQALLDALVPELLVNWSGITTKATITYGDSKASAFTALPSTGTATLGTGSVAGTFSIVDPSVILQAGSKTITVKFTVTTAGIYNGIEITKEYPIMVNPKLITVTVDAASREYGAANPTFTATASTGVLVGSDTINDLSLSLTSSASATDVPGAYDVTGTASNANYTVTVSGTGKLTVTKAALTLTGTPSPISAILASDTANNDLTALTAAVQAANPTLTATYAGGAKTDSLSATWALKTGTFNRKGGAYVFEATLAPATGANFTYSGSEKPTVSVTVTAVTGTYSYSPATLTKAQAEIASATALSDLDLPTSIAITYDNGVSDGPYTITGWNYTLDQLKAIDVTGGNVVRNMIPTVVFPAWATIATAGLETELTITDKYPVTVTVTPPADIVYGGAALGDPSALQSAISNGIDGGATWKYEYKLTTAASSAYTEAKPTKAGEYTVRATLVSDTHSGSGTATFTIGKATYSESITFANSSVAYNGAGKTITATGMNAEVTVSYLYKVSTADDSTYTATMPVNAGTYTVKASFTSAEIAAGNYNAIAEKTATLTISKATPVITLTEVAGILFGDNNTLSISASENNTDAAGNLKFVSSNTAIATVNAAGKVTAAGNGTTTITVSVDATDNFNAASETFTVTAIPNPIIEVIVTSPADGTITAALVGRTIKITGLGDTYTLDITGYAGVTVDDSDIGNGKVTAKLTADTTVTQEYAVDASGLTAKPANVTVGENPAVPDLGAHSSEGALVTALNNPANASDGLIAAIADTIAQVGTAAGNDPVTVITYVKMEVIDYTANESLTLDISPYYTINGGQEIPVTSLNSPVTVTVALPAGITTTNLKILHNVNGTMVGVDFIDNGNGTVTFTIHSFSEFSFLTDARTVDATFTTDDGTEIVKTYTLTDIGTALPSDSKSGYTFNGWQIDGIGFAYSGLFTEAMLDAFIAAGSTISLTPKFTLNSGGSTVIPPKEDETEWKNPYSDVRESDWFYDAVQFVTEKELMNGVGSGLFDPYGTTNRAVIVTILWRLEGEPNASGSSFTDVPNGQWYSKAVAWAASNGIVSGYGDGRFGPNDPVTRQQMAAIMYHYAEYKGMDVSATDDLSAFKDVSNLPEWAKPAVKWAVATKLLKGNGDGTLDPEGHSQRSHVATIFQRFIEK